MSYGRTDYDYLSKIAFVGPTGAGKSAALARITDHPFPHQHLATIGVEFGSKIFEIPSSSAPKKKMKLQIWDTAGQQRFRSITSSYHRGAHLVAFFVDSTKKLEEQREDLIAFAEQSSSNGLEDGIRILVVTKTDKKPTKLTEEDLSEIQRILDIDSRDSSNVVQISSKDDTNLGIEENGLVGVMTRKLAAYHVKKEQEDPSYAYRYRGRPPQPVFSPEVASQEDVGEIESAFELAERTLRDGAEVFTNPLTQASGTSFKAFVTKAKTAVVNDFKKGKITKQSALNIAEAVDTLAGSVADCTVKTEDLSTFLADPDVQAHRNKSTRFGRIVGGIVGAVVGVVVGAVAGAILGAGTGPGAIATAIMGAVAGGVVGATLFGYGAGRFSLWHNPLSGLHRKAKAISENTPEEEASSLSGSALKLGYGSDSDSD